MLQEQDYSFKYENKIITISHDGVPVLQYPINAIIQRDTTLLIHPEQLFTYRNDSLMLVFNQILVEDSVISYVNSVYFRLFRKETEK